MGSGHFLVAELPILVAIRMAEEGLAPQDAVQAVLRDNLFGLELDPRYTQIAAFNLALAAWKRIGQPVDLPPLNLACSGLALGGTREEWMQSLKTADSGLRFFLGQLYELFGKAPELGSLITPARLIGHSLHAEKLPKLLDALDTAMERENLASRRFQAPDVYERGVTAQGMAAAARLLANRYHLVATNVPYLVRNKQGEGLRRFIASQYPNSILDLATAFLERCREFCVSGGIYATVTPQNWLFLTSYRNLREKLLHGQSWNHATKVGSGATAKESWEVLRTLSIISNCEPSDANLVTGLEASFPIEEEKATWLKQGDLLCSDQDDQLKNPDARIALQEAARSAGLLQDYADGLQDIASADYPRYGRCFWELPKVHADWIFQQSTVRETIAFGGREHILWWEDGKGALAKSSGARVQGLEAWGKLGIAVTQMRKLSASLYTGESWDNNVAVILPHDPSHLLAIWAFCQSPKFNEAVRRIDQKINVTNATVVKVPFDLAHWQKVANKKYPNDLPKPYSDDPMQWLFNGHPRGMDESLQVAVGRLLGYCWPRQTGSDFPDCPALGPDGLEAFADEDGTVCIPSVRGERPAAERLRELLAAAFGDAWSPTLERELIAATESSAGTLDDWLRNDFFEQHCKLFHHRPFIWHIWDGRRRDGFHALVNYHKLAAPNGEGRKLLENLTYSYLGDWITRQRDGVKRGESGADDRLAAALELGKRLKTILEGEPPFDIFVRWKPIDQQPIGWEPDLNDGVRLNIRPFMADGLPNGRKGAGILRWKPNIKWGKDRGKEPIRPQDQYPWFWENGTFTGERLNDVHLTNAERCRARASKGDGE